MGYRDRARRIHESRPVVDGHNDLPWALRNAGYSDLAGIDLLEHQPAFHTDIPRLLSGGVGLQFWSVWVPASNPTPLQTTLDQIDLVEHMCRAYPDHLGLAGSMAEAAELRAAGRIAGMLGAEGGHSIEGSLDALHTLYDRGVRYMTLTHTRTIEWADSATDDAVHGGLTPFGKDVIREMNRLGMAVDISHCSTDTARDALEVSEAPVVASHSSALAIAPHPRNIPDDVLRSVASGEGVVMVCFYPPFVVGSTAVRAVEILSEEQRRRRAGQAEEEINRYHDQCWADDPPDVGTVSTVADHVEHIADVAGVDHVGIGSDYDGMSLVPAGLDDASSYPNLTAELLERGWTETDVTKVLGDNARRTFSAIEAARETGR